MTNASKDDKLVAIRSEFGMWGIGTYWTLVEMVAEQVSEKTELAEATLIVSELLGYLGCKRNKLDSYLTATRNLTLIESSLCETNKNILKINIPKLLEYADNYIKYDGKSLKTLQRQINVSSKQDKIRSEENRSEEKRIDKEDPCSLVMNQWNSFAKEKGLSEIIALSSKRKAGISARAKEATFDLSKIFELISTSPFLLGRTTDWRVDFDFVFCSENNYKKILEGKYNNNGTHQKHSGNNGQRPIITNADIERVARQADAIQAQQRLDSKNH
jgi:hypothetical protein